MTTLNVTYNGISTDYPLETTTSLSDSDIKRIAAEIAELPPDTFELFVVDRMEQRVYLRPKVPFGRFSSFEEFDAFMMTSKEPLRF